jgi:hypothetical protein
MTLAHSAAKFIWDSHAPPRVQFFVWLLIHGRVQCRVNLCRKSIVDSPMCEVCNQAEEMGEHIIFDFPFAQEFWLNLGFHSNQTHSNDRLINVQCPSAFPKQHFSTFMALCYWHHWKRRNGIVFRDEVATIRQTVRLIEADAKLWERRLPKKDRTTADAWCQFLVSICN